MDKMKNTLCVLCGGLGTRVNEVAGDRSKSMLDLKGKPLLLRVLEQTWEKCVFDQTILLAGYKGEDILDYFSNSDLLSKNIKVIVEPKKLGTGGALLNALPSIKTDGIVVTNGDTLTDFAMIEFLTFARQQDCSVVIGGIYVDCVSDYGALEIDDDKHLRGLHEKTRVGPGLASCGIVYFKTETLTKMKTKLHSTKEDISLEADILPMVIGEAKVWPSEEASFFDVGTPERLLQAIKDIK